MFINQYIKKFYGKLEFLKKQKPSMFCVMRHAVQGIMDYLIFGSTITDYFELTFWNKTYSEKRQYVTRRFYKKFIDKIDSPQKRIKLFNKKAMYSILKDYTNRKQLDTFSCSLKEFQDFVILCPKFLFKPDNDSCGNGIKLYDISKDSIEDVYEKVKNQKGLLDEIIVQHNKMSTLSKSSVNTLRIFTLRTNDTIYFTGTALRIGTDSFIDNYSAGGLVLSINNKTGKAESPAENYMGDRFYEHPITKTVLQDFEVPRWKDAVSYIFEIAKDYPLNYVAWDLAILEDGFTIVEANPAGMINVIQIAGAGGKMKLYKKLDEEWNKHPYVDSGDKTREFKKVLC